MRPEVTELLEGNLAHTHEFRARFDDVQDAQHPIAVTVTCADSRVLADHLWGNDDPGRLFSCRNIGNRAVQRVGGDDVVSGDVLYPLLHAGTEIAIVVGHTGCGAITATYDDLTGGLTEPPGITHCANLSTASLAPAVEHLPPDLRRPEAVNRLVEYTVDRQVERLLASEAVPHAVTVVGGVYDFQDVYGGDRGEVHVVNVDGETTVEVLRDAHPAVESRITRLWEY